MQGCAHPTPLQTELQNCIIYFFFNIKPTKYTRGGWEWCGAVVFSGGFFPGHPAAF